MAKTIIRYVARMAIPSICIIVIRRAKIASFLEVFDNRLVKKRDHDFVVASQRVGMTPRSAEDVLMGAVVLKHVQIRGGEVFDLISQVAGHRQGLQKDLG